MRIDLPKRKLNRLKSYDYSSHGAYFITICTKDRKNIFWEDNQLDLAESDVIFSASEVRLSHYGKIVEDAVKAIPRHYSHIELLQYVIMPNHVHLVLFVKYNDERLISSSASVLKAVGYMKRSVSIRISGSIWQKSFYDHVIRNEGDYEDISKYIYENPIKWKSDRFYSK